MTEVQPLLFDVRCGDAPALPSLRRLCPLPAPRGSCRATASRTKRVTRSPHDMRGSRCDSRPLSRRSIPEHLFAATLPGSTDTFPPNGWDAAILETAEANHLTLDGDDECGSEHGDADIRQDNNSMDEEDSEGWIRCMSIPSRMG